MCLLEAVDILDSGDISIWIRSEDFPLGNSPKTVLISKPLTVELVAVEGFGGHEDEGVPSVRLDLGPAHAEMDCSESVQGWISPLKDFTVTYRSYHRSFSESPHTTDQ